MEFSSTLWPAFCYTLTVVVVVALLAFVLFDWQRTAECSFAVLSNHLFNATRQELFGQLGKSFQSVRGDVLEIGLDRSTTSRYFLPGTYFIALDPKPSHGKVYRKNYMKGFSLKFYSSEVMERKGANEIPIADRSVAAVVSACYLCSLSEVQLKKTLQEIKRVLKQGGRFFFVEHVLDEAGTWRHSIQKVIESSRFWVNLLGGCHIGRKTWLHLEKAGFKNISYKRFSLEPPPESWLLESAIALYLPSSILCGYAEV